MLKTFPMDSSFVDKYVKMVMIRVAVVLLVLSAFAKEGVNGLRVTGGNVQFSSDKKTLTLQLQLDGAGQGGLGGLGGQGGQAGQAGPGGAGGGSQSGEFTDEEQQGLATHNKFRATHGVPLMTLDRQMCDQAKAYAVTLAKTRILRHSSKRERQGQGENLSMGCSSNKAQAMEEAVTNWYNEVCAPGYQFNAGGKNRGTGHFTQVVWKESTVLGIGRAESEENDMKCAYIVGRYKPAGNYMGEYQQNVPKGSFDASSYCATIKNNGFGFDQQGDSQQVVIGKSAVDSSIQKTGSAESRGPRNLN